MTEAQAVEAVFERWTTQWAILHPADVPYTLDNEAFTAPDKWARVSMVISTRNQVSLGPPGTRRFETRGNIAVQLFGAVDSGAHELAALCDDVRTVFEGQLIAVTSSDNVNCYAGTTRPVATDGRWFMRLVTIAVMFYEQR